MSNTWDDLSGLSDLHGKTLEKHVSRRSSEGGGKCLTGCDYVQILTVRVRTDVPIVILSDSIPVSFVRKVVVCSSL